MAEEIKNQENQDVFEKQFLSTPQLVWRALKRHKFGLISMWVLIILYLLAIFADFLSPMDYRVQHIQYKYAPPMKVFWKDETGKFSAPHVYLYKRVKDPVTFQSRFKEATYFSNFKVYDDLNFDIEKETVLEIGKYNPDFESTVTNYQFVLNYKTVAVTHDGKEYKIDLETKTEPLLTFEELGIKDKILSKNDEGFISAEQVPLLSGEEVLLSVESRGIASTFYFEENYKTKANLARYNLKPKDIIEFKKYVSLDVIEVETENDVYEYYPENFKGVNFKKFNIKFFTKGWEYKWLGFIPGNLHLFGVEKSKLPFLAEDYSSKDGIIYLWGADKFGRDMISRLIFGSRVSLTIGLLGIAITFTIGLMLGGTAGYFGGWIDEILMRFTEILMSIPSFYLLVSLSAILPSELSPSVKYILIIVILSFIGWPGMTRVIRGMTLGLKETEFIQAAVALGYPSRRIIWKHLLPNTATYVIVSATLSIPSYILGEAGLSFLGLGIREPSASWGLMLSQAQNITALTNYPWLLLPGLFIFITVLAFNLFGDAIRDALDPRALGH
ncbi:peptide/nickel transport system permease protein [Marinitoga hydrogenitolerans DSM 16785]|uniref:Peptide/nickel transport system permease protein n=1 Tax=Marinitoga hydrogenitolerans (strain DSM 16785 / JCM 12826 / AT1271) TaxID=1122195 RepID=A0A1M4UHA8_MARH1|nr:ABC transporter permease [Marinitoga hydrogenitolerans]SHE55940.1 peptide/nickel transport system permease protein [Marinitoga hydrogenitolerans DSM 16785]